MEIGVKVSLSRSESERAPQGPSRRFPKVALRSATVSWMDAGGGHRQMRVSGARVMADAHRVLAALMARRGAT